MKQTHPSVTFKRYKGDDLRAVFPHPNELSEGLVNLDCIRVTLDANHHQMDLYLELMRVFVPSER